jgi:hypothetical protein
MSTNLEYAPQRDEHGVIMNPSQKVKEFVEKVRTAIGWADRDETHKIKVYGAVEEEEDRAVLVVQITGTYFLVRADTHGEPWFFHINKGRAPKFFLMDPSAVVPWAETYIAGVPIGEVNSLISCGAILMAPVRAMPPEKSQQSIKSQRGNWNARLYGRQRIAVTGKLVERSRRSEWFADGKIEVETNAGQPPIIVSGKYRIIVGEPGNSPGFQSVSTGYTCP